MTDKKISALTDLGGAPASTDVLPIVDSSANQTKKVSVEDLFTNPDVTGALTVSSGVYLGGTASANLLDDYEEGTFTPLIEGSTTAGTGTYSYQFGYYTKIGRMVVAQVRMAWTGHTGTGSINLTGLPFVSASSNGYAHSPTLLYSQGLTLPANSVQCNGVVGTNSTSMDFNTTIDGGNLFPIPIDTNVSVFAFSLVYFTA